ncbi:MAG: tRNA (N6-isopentenyl adenosine(37)-C2)-methylthiotransferase MiaB, partial [Candidatus Omnitrophica bacterium]|nr:tRNA (N6-isopentenyl adenosine(37)-C2)-methylthiotransferase MiaB [Candidatus Omnitrophota bacterium]
KNLKRHGKHFVYIVQCQDGTYYAGYTNNIAARIRRHNAGFASKYTRPRLPVTLAWKKEYRYFKPAFLMEKRIKKLTRKQKELLVGRMRLDKVLSKKNNPSHLNIGLNAASQPLTRSASGCQPKVFIKTFGCQMNKRDSEALAGLFLERGYSLAQNLQEADVILVNTCSVREHAENRAISFLGSLKKLSTINYKLLTKLIIGLIGCMAKNRGEEIFKKMPHIDLICGPASLGKIPAYVEKIQKEKIRIIDLEDKSRAEDFYRACFRVEPEYAQVVISTGCSNFCSYCVVPYARGVLRLRNPQDIIDEVKRNVELGIKKITLLGQNVNDYQFASRFTLHASRFINFVELLKMVEEVEGVEEIDFVTSQPKNTSRELFTFMAQSSRIRKHLHLPFQSGSNMILELMNRGYSKEKYLSLIKDYKNITGGTLSTDVIVGFPTEGEDDFNQTKEILEEVKFRYAYIFKYSPRPRTEAAKLDDDVTKEIKERRHKILLDLQKQISLGYREKCISSGRLNTRLNLPSKHLT